MKNFTKLILLLLLLPLFALGQTPIYTEQFAGTTAPTGWLVTNAGAGNNWTSLLPMVTPELALQEQH